MNVLALNVGSSSVKYSIFENETRLFKGGIFNIGKESYQVHNNQKNTIKIKSYSEAIRHIIHIIDKNKIKINAVAHRVVHGGTLEKSSVINSQVLNKIKKTTELAPLHNVYAIKGIEICLKLFKVPQVAVFDTAFHQTLPKKAYTYALPTNLMKKYNIRKYGFHGISHHYVAQKACDILKKKIKKQNIITCHLGNGCSITAIQKGKSIDTSMGFTPLEGLVMGTRCGDIDPAIITFLMDHELFTTDEINLILNNKSGLFAISEKTKNVEELLKSKDPKSKLAIEIFTYRIVKYIGAYAAALNGVDAIVFTAGIGENAWQIREKILNNLGYLGVKLDKKKNKNNQEIISHNRSKVKVLVIPTDEALMMSKEVKKIVKK